MIETYLLEALVAFKENGTLSSAADSLHISQPALSRSMQKLEDILQVSLFERTKNRLVLNETGKLALEYAERILSEQKNMISAIQNYDRSLHIISIGYSAPGPMYIFPNIASRYAKDASIASVMENEETLIKGLLTNKYQIIVIPNKLDDDRFYCEPTIVEHLYASVVPANPISLYKDTGIHFKDMDGETFLMNQNVGSWDAIARNNLPHSRLLLQDNSESLREIINTSSLSGFATNVTFNHFNNEHYNERIYVPFLDEDAYMQFYFICLAKNKDKFKKVFANITKDAS